MAGTVAPGTDENGGPYVSVPVIAAGVAEASSAPRWGDARADHPTVIRVGVTAAS